MQPRVHPEVERAQARGGRPPQRTPAAWGVPPSRSSRGLPEAAWARDRPHPPPKPGAPDVAGSEENRAGIASAPKHPRRRHRARARRLVDQDRADLGPAPVDRARTAADPVGPGRRRARRERAAAVKAAPPGPRWATDRPHLQVGAGTPSFIAFLEASSRPLVHPEGPRGGDGLTARLAAPRALGAPPRGDHGPPPSAPEIRPDHGSGFRSQEFQVVLEEDGLGRPRIPPHRPEGNGRIGRSDRTARADLGGGDLATDVAAERVRDRLARRYHPERLPSALADLPPWEFHRGDPPRRFGGRRAKRSQARHRRRERDLRLRQGT